MFRLHCPGEHAGFPFIAHDVSAAWFALTMTMALIAQQACCCLPRFPEVWVQEWQANYEHPQQVLHVCMPASAVLHGIFS
jgi:hypothetical protein